MRTREKIGSLSAIAFAIVAGGWVGCSDAQESRGTSELALGSTEADSDSRCGCDADAAAPGAALWIRDLGGETSAADVAVDGEGNVAYASSRIGLRVLGPDGSDRWSAPTGSVVATDEHGHVYSAYRPSDASDASIEVVKRDRHGDVVWSRTIDAAPGDLGGIAVDDAGEVVVSGVGPGTIKLRRHGHIAWSKPFGGDVAIDRHRHVLLAGSFVGTVDFGAGPVTSAGRADAFVVKLDARGDYEWGQFVGDAPLPFPRPNGQLVTSPNDQVGRSIAVRPDGNVVVVGWAADTIDLFGDDFSIPLITHVPGPFRMFWRAELDRAGNVVSKNVPTNAPFIRDVAGVAVDRFGGTTATGSGPADVNPYRENWIYSSPRWSHTRWPEGTYGLGAGEAVAADRCGNVYWATTSRVPGRGVHSFLLKLAR